MFNVRRKGDICDNCFCGYNPGDGNRSGGQEVPVATIQATAIPVAVDPVGTMVVVATTPTTVGMATVEDPIIVVGRITMAVVGTVQVAVATTLVAVECIFFFLDPALHPSSCIKHSAHYTLACPHIRSSVC